MTLSNNRFYIINYLKLINNYSWLIIFIINNFIIILNNLKKMELKKIIILKLTVLTPCSCPKWECMSLGSNDLSNQVHVISLWATHSSGPRKEMKTKIDAGKGPREIAKTDQRAPNGPKARASMLSNPSPQRGKILFPHNWREILKFTSTSSKAPEIISIFPHPTFLTSWL